MTMLEQMARATYAAWIADVQDLEPRWDDLPESHRHRLTEATRSGLMAAREPTKAMVDAGVSETWEAAFIVRDSYTAVIDAVLRGAA